MNRIVEGMKVEANVKLVENIRMAIFEVLKMTKENPKIERLTKPLLMALPLFMLNTTGELNFEFNSLKEI